MERCVNSQTSQTIQRAYFPPSEHASHLKYREKHGEEEGETLVSIYHATFNYSSHSNGFYLESWRVQWPMLLTAPRAGGEVCVWENVCLWVKKKGGQRSRGGRGWRGIWNKKTTECKHENEISWLQTLGLKACEFYLKISCCMWRHEKKCQCVCVCACPHENTQQLLQGAAPSSPRGRSKAVDLVWKSRELDRFKWSSEE